MSDYTDVAIKQLNIQYHTFITVHSRYLYLPFLVVLMSIYWFIYVLKCKSLKYGICNILVSLQQLQWSA